LAVGLQTGDVIVRGSARGNAFFHNDAAFRLQGGDRLAHVPGVERSGRQIRHGALAQKAVQFGRADVGSEKGRKLFENNGRILLARIQAQTGRLVRQVGGDSSGVTEKGRRFRRARHKKSIVSGQQFAGLPRKIRNALEDWKSCARVKVSREGGHQKRAVGFGLNLRGRG